MKYKYTAASGQTDIGGRDTKRPVVQLELSRGSHRRPFLALVDSGADQIMMPSYVADLFGIDREACPNRASMGISMEPMPGFVADLTFYIEGQPASFEAPAVFIDAEIPILLGREGFFDRHRIEFEQDRDVFEINRSAER